MDPQVPKPNQVLTKAVLRSAAKLGLSAEILASTLGVSRDTLAGLSSGCYLLAPETQEWERAVLLVRVLVSLIAIVAGSMNDASLWLNSSNSAFEGRRPLDLFPSLEGLRAVATYLESCRNQQ